MQSAPPLQLHLCPSAPHADCYEELLRVARKDRKPPADPFTRRELPPSTSEAEMRHFCSAPLQALGLERFVASLARSELGHAEVRSSLQFDVSQHPDARSKVAVDMIDRLEADTEVYARVSNASTVPCCVFLSDAIANEVVSNPDGNARQAAAAEVRGLINELAELRERDAASVRDALPMLLKRATAVPLDDLPSAERRERQAFQLRQLAEQEASVSLEHMFCLLISGSGAGDLRAANPYVSELEAEDMLDLAVAVIFHANRVGQINRCMSEARGLAKLLSKPPKADTEAARRDMLSALTLKSQTLAEQLLARRQYVMATETPSSAGPAGIGLQYDPRYLLFEFTHNIVLRGTQVQLVREFVDAVRSGQPLVKQMLMGGGKTTVVGPMLALMLGDGEMLVLQTMPQALLEQSKATLRATFSAIMRKWVAHTPP